MSENAGLIHDARRRVTGANIHQFTALLRGYQFAIAIINHPRCKDPECAKQRARLIERALQEFGR